MFTLISSSILLGALILYVAKMLLSRQRLAGPLPPGPRPTPVLGNISDLPPPGTQDWMHWLQHKDAYGMLLQGFLFYYFPKHTLTQ